MKLKHAEGFFRNKAGHQKRYRRDYHYHSRDPCINRKHKAKRSDDRDHSGKKLGKSNQETICKLIHICHYPADNISMGMDVQVAKRQYFQLTEGLFPNILNNAIHNLIIADTHKPLCQRREDDHHRHFF